MIVEKSPFDGLVLPKISKREQPHFGIEDVKSILAEAPRHYRPALQALYETGIRRGEVCAANVGDVDLKLAVLVVRRSRWGKHITSNKSNRPPHWRPDGGAAVQARHVEAETTMAYTHLVRADERAVADELGKILHANERSGQNKGPAPKMLTQMIQ